MKLLWIPTVAMGLALAGCGPSERHADEDMAPADTALVWSEEAPYYGGPPAGTRQDVQRELPRTDPDRRIDPPRADPQRTAPAQPARPGTRLLTVQQGTGIVVALDEQVSTDTHQAGRSFSAAVDVPVLAQGITAIPAGSTVRGEVTRSESAGRIGGRAHMTLEFRELVLPDGSRHILQAHPVNLEGEGTARGDAQRVIGGTVGGAIIGGIIGGRSGAARGAAAGGAAGGIWAVATRGNDIVLEAGTPVNLTLANSLEIPVSIPRGQPNP